MKNTWIGSFVFLFLLKIFIAFIYNLLFYICKLHAVDGVVQNVSLKLVIDILKIDHVWQEQNKHEQKCIDSR